MLTAAIFASSGWLPAPPPASQVQLSRRAVLHQIPLSATAVAAAAAAPRAALADLSDLSIDVEEAPKPMKTSQPNPDGGAIAVTTLTREEVLARKKAKEQTPFERIKELQAKGGQMTDKEKKELKRCEPPRIHYLAHLASASRSARMHTTPRSRTTATGLALPMIRPLTLRHSSPLVA